MPPALHYERSDQPSDSQRAIEELYEREHRERQRKLSRNWDYYRGKHKKPLQSDGTDVDDNVIINMIGLLVRKSVGELFGTTTRGIMHGPTIDLKGPISFQGNIGEIPDPTIVGGQVRIAPSPEQFYVDETLERNNWLSLFYELAIDGAVCGHMFLKVVPEIGEGRRAMARLVAVDPGVVSVFWDANMVSEPLWYRIQYTVGSATLRQDIVRAKAFRREQRRELGAGAEWAIFDYRRDQQYGNWAFESMLVWPYGYPPIIDWRNFPSPHEYYGEDEIQASGGLNDGLNFTASNMQRILKYYANPRTIGTGVSSESISETGVANFWTIPNSDAKVFNLEMEGDLASSANYIHFLYRAIFDVAQELDPTTVQDKLGHLTNFGLRVLYRETLAKVNLKRSFFGRAIRQIVEAILAVGGFEKQSVSILWPDPLPSDAYESARALEIGVTQFGLSRDTALEEQGYFPDIERARRRSEKEEIGTQPQAEQPFKAQ